MTESELQSLVIEAAELFGWLVYHTHDSRRSQPGFPDLFLVRDGIPMAVELKSAKGRVTAEQRVWLDALEECAGIRTWLVRPDNVDGLLEALR